MIISAKDYVNLLNDTTYGTAEVASTATGGQVSISAGGNINANSGTSIAASGDVQLSSDAKVVADRASITSNSGNVKVLAGTGLGVSSSTITGQQVHLETGAAFKDTAASLEVKGGNVRGATQTTLIATDSMKVDSPGSSAVSGGGNVHIQAAKAVDITAGSTVTAGQHMSVVAGTTLNLQATSGTTATNGKKVTLTANGNMLLSGNSVTATGSNLSAGQDLSIEANDGAAYLYALSNAGGTSVDKINLSAGKDLNVSVFKGSLWATGLQASGQNINLVSNGFTSVMQATVSNGNNIQAVASTLTAPEDITIASINSTPGANSQVQVVASNLNAVGQTRILSNGLALITATSDIVNGVVSPARSNITTGSVAIQGASVYTGAADIRTNGNKTSTARSGDITVTATSGNALFNDHTNIRSEFNSTGNIALHANGNLTHWYTQANAGGSLSNTSATGQINGTGAYLIAKDVLSLTSKGEQTHTSGTYSGGAATVFNETGHLALNSTRVLGLGTTSASLTSVSGQTSIESGGTLGLDAASYLYAATDLSIIQGQGDITINPSTWGRGTFALGQFGYGRNLTLGTRNGNMTLNGAAGFNGYDSSQRVDITTPGSLTLFANNLYLQGSRLRANGGAINLTATTGSLTVEANKASQYSAGFTNTYWDRSQLVASTGIDVRAVGDVQLNGLYAHTWGRANFQSGGNITTSGKVSRWQIDNRPSAGSSFNGWYQDEEWVNYTSITGNQGVNLGAMGGHLRVSGTDIWGGSGTASLQALGHVRLESVMTDRVHAATSTGWEERCFLFFCQTNTWTTYHDRAWRNVNEVSVNARDINIKAGNNVETFATRLNASNNLRIEAGDQALYYAVKNETDHTDRTETHKSFIGIRYDKTTEHNTSRISTPMVSQLYAWNGNLTSWSGSDQLYQGTLANYYSRDIQAGVGEKARADARIILEAVKTTVFKQRTKESNYVLWQTLVNQGSNTETLTLPSFTGKVNTPFRASGGISVQIPAGDFKSQIGTLSQQPGMGYLNDLAVRNDVNWQPVKLAYEQWNYVQEGLTPAGAALLAAAVAWAMPTGLGTSGVNSLFGTQLTGTTALMTNAAFTSLASQASIMFVNNKGDVGKTLKEMGSSQTVKATIAAALTAGVLEKLGAANGMSEIKVKLSNGTAGFSEKLTYNLINATGRALTNTAINGGNLEDALKQALIGGIVDTAHGQVASQIKGLESDYLAHKLAHALAGCVAGAAAGGTCKDGAIGGAVGEIVAQLMPPKNGIAYSESEKNNVLALSKLVAGATSAYAGGNAQTAITTAETAVTNNALVPVLIGLAWLADKAWTAYEVSQDVAAIRDGTKTVQEVALDKGEEYVTGIIIGNIGRYGVKAVKAGGKWVQTKDPFSNVMESRGTSNLPSTSIRLAEKDDALKQVLYKLPAGERVALIRQEADEAARIHGFTKDNALSTMNNRTVYRGTDGKVYSLDTEKGRFELINPKTGKHEGEFSMFQLNQTGITDTSGRHDLRVKS